MLKTRKRWISLLVTLAMLVAFIVPAGTAFGAATTYSAATIEKVQDGTDNAKLGSILIEISSLAPGSHEAWVSLPSDYDINAVSTSDNSVNVNVYATADGSDGFKLTVVNTSASNVTDYELFLNFDQVDIPSGATGDIKATIDNLKGQLVDGEVVIGRVTGGALKVTVLDTETFSDAGGQVTFRVEETVAGTLNDEDTLDLILPDGFEWGSITATALWGEEATNDPIDNGDINITGTGTDELNINVDNGISTTSRAAFRIVANIVVADTDDAEFGDVIAKIKGNYDVTPSEAKVGTYGDFSVSIEADDSTVEAYAGRNEQGVSDIVVKEGIAGSLIPGRTITLTLPDNARWVKVNDQNVHPEGDTYSELDIDDPVTSTDNDIRLIYSGLQGTDDRTLKLEVEDTTNDSTVGSTAAAELTIEDIQVALEAGVTGDLVVKLGGSAGLTGEITIAKVIAPVTVTAEKKNVQIGKFGQEAGTITITEAKAEAIDENGELTVTLPEDVEFDGTPVVKVTEGDLEISDYDVEERDGNDVLVITFDDESNEASTIEISGIKYAINRVLAEGDIKVDVGGSAVVETNIESYDDLAGNSGNAGLDPFFEDSGAVATVVNALCVTPAPVEQKGTAVFKIGDPSYTLNGATITMDAAPYIKADRTFVPVRFAANAVGVSDANILWDPATQKVTVIKGDRVVQMTIGSNVMLINGAAITMDAAPEISNGRTMLPIRFLGQALGAEFVWDAAAQTVTVNF